MGQDANGLVLCVDEKTQIQALNRRAGVPSAGPRRGPARLRPPRHLEPYAAWTCQRPVIGSCTPATARRVLASSRRSTPRARDLDCTGAGQRLHPQDTAVKRWLTTHPRFVLHFTPTSSHGSTS